MFYQIVYLVKQLRTMATIATLPIERKTKNGQTPLALRITLHRKTVYLFLGHSIELKNWDNKKQRAKKAHPNSLRLNNFITKKINEAEDLLLQIESKKLQITLPELKRRLSGRPDENGTFKKVSDSYLEHLLQNKKLNQYSSDKSRINHFLEFAGASTTIEEISEPLILKFGAYLKIKYKVGDRTVMNHFVVLRTIFNRAITEKLVDNSTYPFGKGGVKIKMPESKRVGLEMEELRRIEELALEENTPTENARNVFLVSFYLAGARISDVLQLKWTDINNGRLSYIMGKNQKVLSIKVTPKLQVIFNNYESKRMNTHAFVLPYLNADHPLQTDEQHKRVRNANKVINKHLKHIATLCSIDKPVTMHIARHTFGNISGDRIPIQMLQKLYRHSTVTTTINYQAGFINKDTDDALEKVIGSS
jgi:integrase/recombinase XerD